MDKLTDFIKRKNQLEKAEKIRVDIGLLTAEEAEAQLKFIKDYAEDLKNNPFTAEDVLTQAAAIGQRIGKEPTQDLLSELKSVIYHYHTSEIVNNRRRIDTENLIFLDEDFED